MTYQSHIYAEAQMQGTLVKSTGKMEVATSLIRSLRTQMKKGRPEVAAEILADLAITGGSLDAMLYALHETFAADEKHRDSAQFIAGIAQFMGACEDTDVAA